MGSLVGIVHLEEAKLISALFGTVKLHNVEELFVVRSVRALDDTILPRRTGLACAVKCVERHNALLEGCASFRMRPKAHGELQRIVSPCEPDRRQMTKSTDKHTSSCLRAMIGVDPRVLDACAHVNNTDLALKAGTTSYCWKLLYIHLYSVSAYGQRSAFAV